jgi:hypothetical protein
MGMDLVATVYALDSTTIDLCLGLFDWAPFRSTKAAVKMHTLLDLSGSIPAFIHISDGKLHDVHVKWRKTPISCTLQSDAYKNATPDSAKKLNLYAF